MAFLSLNEVSYTYPRYNKPVLTGINLALENKGLTAIVGPNGCGKSTLTKLMVGIMPATDGKIILNQKPINEYSLAQIGRHIGYVFQNPDLQLFCNTVTEELSFVLNYRGGDPQVIKHKVDLYLDYFNLYKYRNAFPLNLSQGEKRRLAIAAVLVNEPEFLIIDEPTVGLDAYHKKVLGDYLQKVVQMGRGLIMVSHDKPFVKRMADRVIFMGPGCIQAEG